MVQVQHLRHSASKPRFAALEQTQVVHLHLHLLLLLLLRCNADFCDLRNG
jgi:hypothetical protein